MTDHTTAEALRRLYCSAGGVFYSNDVGHLTFASFCEAIRSAKIAAPSLPQAQGVPVSEDRLLANLQRPFPEGVTITDEMLRELLAAEAVPKDSARGEGRNAIIEECARIAENFYDNSGIVTGNMLPPLQKKIAIAIRALSTSADRGNAS